MKKFRLIIFLLIFPLALTFPQSIMSLNTSGGLNYLFEDSPAAFKPGITGDLRAYLFKAEDDLFQFSINSSYSLFPTISIDSVSVLDLGIGASLFWPLANRFGFRAEILGGATGVVINSFLQKTYDNINGTPWGITPFIGADTVFNWYVTPDISLVLDIGAKYSFGMPLGVHATAGVSFLIPRTDSKLSIKNILATTVIPAFNNYYLENPVMRIDIMNKEKFTIHSLNISVLSGNLTEGNSIDYNDSILPNEELSIYLPVEWNKKIIEREKSSIESLNLEISYTVPGRKRVLNQTAYCLILGKNNFIWQTDYSETGDELLDYLQNASDAKAAVFVNPNDEQMIQLARRIKDEIEKKLSYDGLPTKFKTIYSISSYLQSRNLRYQVDPNSVPYGKTSKAQTDYLRYPHETLSAGYGDCDDLSILCASILESGGVPVAFLTIPGHIFIAADSGLTKENANFLFGNVDLFIEENDKLWIPIEITEIMKGLKVAWNTGIKEWHETYEGDRGFFELEKSWQEFKPSTVVLMENNKLLNLDSSIIEIVNQNRYELSMDVLNHARQQLQQRLYSESTEQQAIEYSRLARREFTFGRLDEAYIDINKAVLLNPTYKNFYNASLIAKAAGKINDSIKFINNAIALNNTDKAQNLLASIIQDSSAQNQVIIVLADNGNKETERAMEQGTVLSWEE